MPYVTTRGGVYRAQVAGFFDRSGPRRPGRTCCRRYRKTTAATSILEGLAAVRIGPLTGEPGRRVAGKDRADRALRLNDWSGRPFHGDHRGARTHNAYGSRRLRRRRKLPADAIRRQSRLAGTSFGDALLDKPAGAPFFNELPIGSTQTWRKSWQSTGTSARRGSS